MSLLNKSSPIAKTAFDSLQAKQSAVEIGYCPMVVRNADVYSNLILTATNDRKVRRQTPLVNAGYASRVLAVSHSIDAFCRYHESLRGIVTASAKIQIVFLGCGADVIGLWADSLVEHQELLIVELDKPEVCVVKKKLLLEKGFVEAANSDEPEDGTLTGHTCKKGKRDRNLAFNYILCPVDLTDISGLDLFAKKYIDPCAPTLVVSELVLAYLPPSDTDNLLSWCRSSLLASDGSAMVVLEPLDSSQSSKIMSVEDGYRREYCNQFGSKMKRGKSTTTASSIGELSCEWSTPFYPIATSHEKVEERFLQAGFQSVFAASLGSVAANTSCSSDFRIPEVFDEHAALALHLSSYTLAVAFAQIEPNQETTRNILMRLLCSAKCAASEISPRIERRGCGAIVYTVMELHDELSMRNLFYRTYSGHFKTYPAIRKMVNTTMDRELAPSLQPSNSHDDTTMNRQGCSEITDRYMAQGGCFFVARHYYGTTGEEQVLAEEIQYQGYREEVVGCVGIRHCESKDSSLGHSGTLEIFRMAVDEKFRGEGIGRSLLQVAEDFACSRGSTKLIANTLTILDTAIRLYEACGYEMEKDTPLGKSLTLRTYAKTLPGF